MIPGDPEPTATSCSNCGAALHGPFCAACGQHAKPLNPPLRDAARDLAHELIDVDGRTIRSIRRLLLSPGFLTREYFEGRRAPWLSPLRLYLIFSVLFFAASSLMPAGSLDARFTSPGDTEAERQKAAAAMRNLGYNSELDFQRAVGRVQATWMPRVMFLLVPLFAWFVQIARRRASRGYPQHLFFALHVHAVWFAGGALSAAVRAVDAGPISRVVRGLVFVYAAGYFVLALRNAYGGTLGRATVHAFLIGVTYWICAGLVTLGILYVTLFRAFT